METGAAGSGAGEQVLLDESALDKVRQLGGAALLARLIDMFLENAPDRLARALDGARASDLDAIERATHSLKSTAGNLGARRLQMLSQQIEELATAGEGAALAPLLAELETTYEATRVVLADERERLGP